VSFVGYFNLLATEHPGTWRELEHATEPIAQAMATVVGHPVLASVSASNLASSEVSYTRLGVGAVAFWLSNGESAELKIDSPDTQHVALLADVAPGPFLAPGASYKAVITTASGQYAIALPTGGGQMSVSLEVHGGVNRLQFTTVASATKYNPKVLYPTLLVRVSRMWLAGT
jgi:hypothetical protein